MKSFIKTVLAIHAYPRTVIGVIALFTLLGGAGLSLLHIDLSLSKRFVAAGEAAQTYGRFRKTFGEESSLVVIAVCERS